MVESVEVDKCMAIAYLDFVNRSDVSANCFKMFQILPLIHWERFLPEISPHDVDVYVG